MRDIVAHGSTAVKVDGPYGEPKEMLAESDTPMLLVAGGIGVSPGWPAPLQLCALACDASAVGLMRSRAPCILQIGILLLQLR